MKLVWLSLALALAAGAPESRAHSWFDPWCCNDRDCQPIPDSAVRITPQGYVITLFYACIYPDPSSMRCFYAKPSGS